MQTIESSPASAVALMETDRKALEEGGGEPRLHLYQWEAPSLTYGYFIRPEKLLDLSYLAAKGVQCARRPTGGGVIFHLTDLAFSLFVPATHSAYSLNTMENYRFVNEIVQGVVLDFCGVHSQLLQQTAQPPSAASRHFCMAHPTRYDLMVEGRKVGGAAQRRTKRGFLHQGSIFLLPLGKEPLEGAILDPSISFVGHPLFMDGDSLERLRRELGQRLQRAFLKALSPGRMVSTL